MNKKGIIFVVPIAVGIIAIISLFLLLTFGTAYLLDYIKENSILLVGIGVLVGFFFALINGMKTGFTQSKMVILLVILFIGIFFVFGAGILQQGIQDDYFQVPEFGYIQCSPSTGSPVLNIEGIDVNAQSNFVRCPENSKTCNVYVTYPKRGVFTKDRQVEYYSCKNTNFEDCTKPPKTIRISQADEYFILSGEGQNLATKQKDGQGRVLYVEFQKGLFSYATEKPTEGRVRIEYQPYILRSFTLTGGGLNEITTPEIGCKLKADKFSSIDAVISSTLNTNDDTSKGLLNPSKTQLLPDETFNFIVGTLTKRIDGNIVNYNGNTGYCAENIQGKGATIFGIGEVKTTKSTYKVVDTGKVLAQSPQIECCLEGKQISPNTICKNFKIETIKTDPKTGESNIECVPLTNPCNPGKFGFDDGTKRSYDLQCINNKCVVSNVKVEECVSSGQCGSNQICVNFQCKQAGEIPTTQISESSEVSPLSCKFYEVYTPSKSETSSILGLKKTTTETPAQCKTSPLAYILIFVIGLVLLISIITLVNKKK